MQDLTNVVAENTETSTDFLFIMTSEYIAEALEMDHEEEILNLIKDALTDKELDASHCVLTAPYKKGESEFYRFDFKGAQDFGRYLTSLSGDGRAEYVISLNVGEICHENLDAMANLLRNYQFNKSEPIHLPQERVFLPTDYIMTSWDIAQAIGWKHEVYLETLEEYESLCDRPFESDNTFMAAIAKIEGKTSLLHFYDYDAVKYLAEQVICDLGDLDNYKYRNVILKRYFELAANPIGSGVSKELYFNAMVDFCTENGKREALEDRLRATFNQLPVTED